MLNTALKLLLIKLGSYIFYLTFLYFWWEKFNSDADIDDINENKDFVMLIGSKMCLMAFIILLVIYLILWMFQLHNDIVYTRKESALRVDPGLVDEQSFPGEKPERFHPLYLYYVFKLFFAWFWAAMTCSIVTRFIISYVLVQERLGEKKYIFVCSKAMMVVNLVIFFIIFEFLKPSNIGDEDDQVDIPRAGVLKQ